MQLWDEAPTLLGICVGESYFTVGREEVVHSISVCSPLRVDVRT